MKTKTKPLKPVDQLTDTERASILLQAWTPYTTTLRSDGKVAVRFVRHTITIKDGRYVVAYWGS
jgi:hypothetical protein